MDNVLDDEPTETMLSLSDYETPSLKLCAKSFDFVNTIIYEELGGRGSFNVVMDEIPTEVFALYLQSGNDELLDERFVLTWIDYNAQSPDLGYGPDPDVRLTSDFLQLTRFYFQPKVSVLSSAVRSGQLNLCTSKFILSYLFGDETSLWDYFGKDGDSKDHDCDCDGDDDSEDHDCDGDDDDDFENHNCDGDEQFDFQKQLADMDAYMDHMVFDFYKKPTACIKL